MIFIPTFNPSNNLIKTLEKLLKRIEAKNIIIVNDGSNSEDSKNVLDIIKKNHKDIIVIDLGSNRGKGYAIKESLKYCKKENKNFALFIDDDGQHDFEDIILIFKDYFGSKKIVIGQRVLSFNKLPIASYIGNKISSIIFFLVTGKNIVDTQCGLRLIPKNYFDFGINLKSEKYDFEYEFLIKCSLNDDLEVIPIKTIYFKKNKDSRFKKFEDSIKVLSVISSTIYPKNKIFFVDILTFIFLQFLNFNFIYSTIIAKALSSIYFLNTISNLIKYSPKKTLKVILLFLLTISLINLLSPISISLNIIIYLILNFCFSIINFRIFYKK